MKPGDIVRRRFPVSVKIHVRKDLTVGTGFTTEYSHTEQHEVEVEVDLAALARMLGGKAVRSRGAKSTEASGAVVVRRVK